MAAVRSIILFLVALGGLRLLTARAVNTVIQFGASMLDSEGLNQTTTAHVYADDGQTLLQAKAALAGWAGALDVVSGAKITSTRARILGPGVTNVAKPVADSEVQEVGEFSFAVADTPYHWSLMVPAILETLTTGGIVIDSDQADVKALINLMLAGVLGGHYTGLNHDTLSAFYRSFQADRKRRRQLFRKSVNYKQPSA